MTNQQIFEAGWVDRWLLRRRLLFYTQSTSVNYRLKAQSGFRIERLNTAEVVQHPEWSEWIPRALSQAEGGNLYLETHLLFAEGKDRPIGAASLLSVHAGSVWYDNVPVKPGEGRLAGLSVAPEFRGLGLGRLLQRHWFNSTNAHPHVRLLSAIVESHRIPSIKAQRSVFKEVTNNWLVKAIGHNMFSIVIGGEHKGIWYVGPGRNCRLRNNG